MNNANADEDEAIKLAHDQRKESSEEVDALRAAVVKVDAGTRLLKVKRTSGTTHEVTFKKVELPVRRARKEESDIDDLDVGGPRASQRIGRPDMWVRKSQPGKVPVKVRVKKAENTRGVKRRDGRVLVAQRWVAQKCTCPDWHYRGASHRWSRFHKSPNSGQKTELVPRAQYGCKHMLFANRYAGRHSLT